MSPWILATIITAGVVALLAVILQVSRAALRAVARTSAERVAKRFRPEEVRRQDLTANFFGLESQGAAQLRGNGALVLTDQLLWFSRAVAEEVFEVPRADVTGVEVVRSHLGKSVGRPLLKVRFRSSNGEDSIAWCVPDVEGWRDALQRPAPR